MQVTSPAGRGTPDPAPAPRWARWFVGVFLGLFLLCGVAGFEAWPLTGWRLSPVLASLAMSLSSVSVLLSSLRLRRFRPSGPG